MMTNDEIKKKLISLRIWSVMQIIPYTSCPILFVVAVYFIFSKPFAGSIVVGEKLIYILLGMLGLSILLIILLGIMLSTLDLDEKDNENLKRTTIGCISGGGGFVVLSWIRQFSKEIKTNSEKAKKEKQ